MIILFSILYAIFAFAMVVVVYHWAITTGVRVEGNDELAAIIFGLVWPLTLVGIIIYSIIPLVRVVEKLVYKRRDDE